MLSVVLFEASKIAFEAVGCGGDRRMIEIMKHVRQGLEQHTAGTDEIAEHPATFGTVNKTLAVTTFPLGNSVEEHVALLVRTDGRDVEKKFPEMFGIGTRGMATAPHEALTLDMDQTSLNEDRRPEGGQKTDHLGIAIHRATEGSQTLFFERHEEAAELRHRVFGDIVAALDYAVVRSIHEGHNAHAIVEEGAVEDKIAILADRSRRRRRISGEPRLHDTTQSWCTESTGLMELTNSVAFDHPALEPDPLTMNLVAWQPPGKRSAAVETPPALSAVAVVAVAFDLSTTALRTMFFS